jgi:ATPase subunit of ABC transporter with duplicated ATPase domains
MSALLTASAVSFCHDGSTVGPLFTGLTLHLAAGDRVAVLGDNGVGKTTLLELVLGRLQPTAGHVALAPDIRRADAAIGTADASLVARDAVVAGDPRLLDALDRLRFAERAVAAAPSDDAVAFELAGAIASWGELDGWNAEARAGALLDRVDLPVERRDAPLELLSGGQRARVGIARALASSAELLVLDEPTEHLDAAGIEWLARELRHTGGGVLFTSHDRWFVEQVATAVLVLERGTATFERGTLVEVEDRLREDRSRRQREWDNDQRRRVALERAAAARISTARSMLVDPATGKGTTHFHYRKRAAKVERTASVMRRRIEMTPSVPRPWVERNAAGIVVDRSRRGAHVLVRLAGARIGWHPAVPVLDGVELEVGRGDHLVLVGPNGIGKSTLLAAASGRLEVESGAASVPAAADVVVVSQGADGPDLSSRLVDACTGLHATRDERRRALELLAALRVRERLLDTTVGELSDGTRRKVALVRALLGDAPLLVLDEPTNHLDLAARDALARALVDHPAAWIIASHDRAFTEQVGGRHVEVCTWQAPDVG